MVSIHQHEVNIARYGGMSQGRILGYQHGYSYGFERGRQYAESRIKFRDTQITELFAVNAALQQALDEANAVIDKLVEPKFKVGDKVFAVAKSTGRVYSGLCMDYTVTGVSEDGQTITQLNHHDYSWLKNYGWVKVS